MSKHKWTVKVKIAGWHNKRNISHGVMEKRSTETIVKLWPIWLPIEIRIILASLAINTRGYRLTLTGLTNDRIQNSKDFIKLLVLPCVKSFKQQNLIYQFRYAVDTWMKLKTQCEHTDHKQVHQGHTGTCRTRWIMVYRKHILYYRLPELYITKL